uniref:ribosomal protein S2 n=1 Tax=Prototheca fontanea TaxID=2836215 RepID=UPI0030032159
MFQTKKQPLTIKEMFKSGMHIGHTPSEWNPKMKPFIIKNKNGQHFLDLIQARLLFIDVLNFLKKSAKQDKKILFIGTKNNISLLIPEIAKSCKAYYVNNRWFGGMLTNWKTIQRSIKQLKMLRKAENLNNWSLLKKKEIAQKKSKKDYLEQNLIGLEKMRELPDIAIIVGQAEAYNAIKECNKLGIKLVTFLDTNCDPTLTDWSILSNDDSPAALGFCFNQINHAINSGQKNKKFLNKIKKQNKKKI